MKHIGTIRSVRGHVVELLCNTDSPGMFDQLHLESDTDVVLVVGSSSGSNTFYCFVLGDIGKLHRGARVVHSGRSISFPVGAQMLGRVVNVLGVPIDTDAVIQGVSHHPVIHSKAVLGVPSTQKVLETGIKIVDFFAPLIAGGKIGLFGGAGVGKTMLLTEILNNVVNPYAPQGRPYAGASDTSERNAQGEPRDGTTDDTVSVFAGVGERAREGLELYEVLKNTGALARTSLVFGAMGKNPAHRFFAAYAAVTLAEYYRDSLKKNVLFFIDNVYRLAQAGNELSVQTNAIPSEDGYQPTLTSEMAQFHERLVSTETAEITTIEAIYVPADDILDHGVQSVFSYLDSILVLSRELYKEGLLPAVDILASTSSAITPTIIGNAHYQAVLAAKHLLEQARLLERIVSLVSVSELSRADQITYTRGKKLQHYMTQRFFVSANQRGTPGVRVPLATTINDVQAIMQGAYDTVPEEQLMFVGALSDVGKNSSQ